MPGCAPSSQARGRFLPASSSSWGLQRPRVHGHALFPWPPSQGVWVPNCSLLCTSGQCLDLGPTGLIREDPPSQDPSLPDTCQDVCAEKTCSQVPKVKLGLWTVGGGHCSTHHSQAENDSEGADLQKGITAATALSQLTVTKCHRLCDSGTPEIISHSSGGWECGVGVPAGPGAGCSVLTWPAREALALPSVLTWVLIPFTRAPPTGTGHLPEAPPPGIITLG